MKKINEIRWNHKTRHWSWLFGRKGHMRKSAGLTHTKQYKGKDNVPLPHNPDPKDLAKNGKPARSYFNPDMQVQHRRTYGAKDRTQDGWRMSRSNKRAVKHQFNEQYKKKRRNKKR